EEFRAKVIVIAAGCGETQRLWLNSELSHNTWVGRGLTNHYMDMATGTFDDKILMKVIGSTSINAYVVHTEGTRLDYPGLGMIENIGESPGLSAQSLFGFSQYGYNKLCQSDSGMFDSHRF